MGHGRVLIVNPLSGIFPHSIASLDLAIQFAELGVEVDFLTCTGKILSSCTLIGELGGSRTIQEICFDCNHKRKQLERIGALDGVNFLSIDRFLQDDKATSIKVDSGRGFSGLSSDLAQIARYEVTLKFKLQSDSLGSVAKKFFRETLESVELAHLAATRLFAGTSYSQVYCYSPQYAVPGAVCKAATAAGVTVFFVEGSSNMILRHSFVRIWDWNKWKLGGPQLNSWPGFSRVVPSTRERLIVWATQFAKRLAEDHSVYSQPDRPFFNPRVRLGIPRKNHLVLLTLSSSDEVAAAQMIDGLPSSRFSSAVFDSQMSWVSETLNFLKDRKDVSVVVRLHPRDFPNKRESVQSEASLIWERLIDNAPSNVKFDLPEDAIPVNSYFRRADLVLSGWSSTLLDALWSGTPAISYDCRIGPFPGDVVPGATSREEYFRLIDQALAGLIRIRGSRERVLRWWTHSQLRGIHPAGQKSSGIARYIADQVARKISKRFPSLKKIFRMGFVAKHAKSDSRGGHSVSMRNKSLSRQGLPSSAQSRRNLAALLDGKDSLYEVSVS